MGWCQVPTIGTLLSGFGAGELFQILRDGVPRTRSELAALTGFSRATITTRIDELLKAGLITPVADAVSTGGRPPPASPSTPVPASSPLRTSERPTSRPR